LVGSWIVKSMEHSAGTEECERGGFHNLRKCKVPGCGSKLSPILGAGRNKAGRLDATDLDPAREVDPGKDVSSLQCPSPSTTPRFYPRGPSTFADSLTASSEAKSTSHGRGIVVLYPSVGRI
jgi:hypothetical protein